MRADETCSTLSAVGWPRNGDALQLITPRLLAVSFITQTRREIDHDRAGGVHTLHRSSGSRPYLGSACVMANGDHEA